MEVRTVTQRERWFLQEMRKAREIKDQNLRKTELKKLERNLSPVQLHFCAMPRQPAMIDGFPFLFAGPLVHLLRDHLQPDAQLPRHSGSWHCRQRLLTTFHHSLLTAQDYDSMIELVSQLSSHPEIAIVQVRQRSL
jgi:hypothetical protein